MLFVVICSFFIGTGIFLYHHSDISRTSVVDERAIHETVIPRITEINLFDENEQFRVSGQNDFFRGWQGVVKVEILPDGTTVSEANYDEFGTVVDWMRIVSGTNSDGMERYDMIPLSGGQWLTEIRWRDEMGVMEE